jgi:hypothetical protein
MVSGQDRGDSTSAREEIHDRIRAHAEAAGVDISTYLIAAGGTCLRSSAGRWS